MSKRLKHKVGNRKRYDYHLTIDGCDLGVQGNPALPDITAGYWVVKKKKTDSDEDALIRIVYNPMFPANPEFQLDTPDVSWVRVEVGSSKATIPAGRYHVALQLEWGSDNKYEWVIGDGTIEFIQDTIRG